MTTFRSKGIPSSPIKTNELSFFKRNDMEYERLAKAFRAEVRKLQRKKT
ncbi:MAG: hypothetical protein VB025_09260 [Sphaerochaeta sp.]|nr:hypothetical protein [Sphaerochaeta sp.]